MEWVSGTDITDNDESKREQECDSVVENEEDAMDKLSTVGRRGWKVQGDSNAITVHSVIYNLTDKTALWIPNEHYGENEYIFKFSVK